MSSKQIEFALRYGEAEVQPKMVTELRAYQHKFKTYSVQHGCKRTSCVSTAGEPNETNSISRIVCLHKKSVSCTHLSERKVVSIERHGYIVVTNMLREITVSKEVSPALNSELPWYLRGNCEVHNLRNPSSYRCQQSRRKIRSYTGLRYPFSCVLLEANNLDALGSTPFACQCRLCPEPRKTWRHSYSSGISRPVPSIHGR